MPFTASHPAIIIPLLNSRILSVSGLIMGSMIPDFEYFLRMQAYGPYGHSVLGMFWLNIPLALGLITVYHNLVRNVLIKHLPLYFEKRFTLFTEFDWNSYFKNNFLRVVFSVLIGNLSHLFWDAFTHFDGFFVTKTSFLTSAFWQIPLYDILQYGCSVIGAVVILIFISKMPFVQLGTTKSIQSKLGYWLSVTVVTVVIFFIRFNNVDSFHFGERIVCLVSAFMAGILLVAMFFRNRPSSVGDNGK